MIGAIAVSAAILIGGGRWSVDRASPPDWKNSRNSYVKNRENR